jgi:pimeloyl-ACP methyl ester carboxylesterase
MIRSIPAFIVAFLLAGPGSAAYAHPLGAAQAAAPAAIEAPARDQLPLRVYVAGSPVGGEQVVVERTADGWLVSSSGRMGEVQGFELRSAELRYAPDWAAQSLTMRGSARGIGFDVRVTVRREGDGAKAEVTHTQGLDTDSRVETIDPGAVLLPNNVFGAYVALARRLVTMQPGASVRVFVAPQGEVAATLQSVTPERLRTPDRAFDVRRHRLTLQNPSGPVTVDVWAEPNGRLARMSIPAASLDVAREDVAAISTRQERFSREGDQDVFIHSLGFNLAATVSKPRGVVDANPKKPARLPAVVLVGGPGQVDRDEVVAGVPLFGQLAAALADAGHLVVRYDKRGLGQSGGRAESATLEDYAEDVRAVVSYLRERKDVDRKRITVLGHAEGGWVAMLAASRDDRIHHVVLAATPSLPGADLVLEQQRALLERAKTPALEIEAKVALQKRINSAVMFGTSWEGVALAVRRQAETPWFASLLRYDPARVMPKVEQPVLIVHGTLDGQVPAQHAERLAEMARARKKGRRTDSVVRPGLDHLFLPAAKGEAQEPGTRVIDPAFPAAVTAWLGRPGAGV